MQLRWHEIYSDTRMSCCWFGRETQQLFYSRSLTSGESRLWMLFFRTLNSACSCIRELTISFASTRQRSVWEAGAQDCRGRVLSVMSVKKALSMNKLAMSAPLDLDFGLLIIKIQGRYYYSKIVSVLWFCSLHHRNHFRQVVNWEIISYGKSHLKSKITMIWSCLFCNDLDWCVRGWENTLVS